MVLFSAHYCRETKKLEWRAHIIKKHHDEEQTCKIALELGWSLKKGPTMPCKACSIGKAKQLVINKHVDKSNKATIAGERIFSDLAMIKALQESSIIVTNKNGILWWISKLGIKN